MYLNAIPFHIVTIINLYHFILEQITQHISDKYQSLFKMQCENDCIANFTKTLENFRLKIRISHDVSKLCLEIAKNSYKM